MNRTWLVGGLSSLHDPLCVAALRQLGVRAQQLPDCTDEAMRTARGRGNHGQCNPAHYAVGPVLEAARRSGLSSAEFGERHAWLVPGSCGPCRLAAFPLEWEQVLEASGLGALEVERIDQLAFVPALTRHGVATSPGRGVVAALVTGDVLATLGHRARPWVTEPASLDALLREATERAAAAIERGDSVRPVLRELGRAARALPKDTSRVLPTVLLVGEPWVTLHDGAPSHGVAKRLGELGAVVLAPTVVEWLRLLAWQRSMSRRVPEVERAAAARSVRALEALWRLLATAAGVFAPLEDPQRLAELAAPSYPPELQGGSAHLEVARSLAAARAGGVQLVLSLKPFGCLPSGSLSDGVLAPLLRKIPGAPHFVALETTGDSAATFDSRLELALHSATLRALDEADGARVG